MWGVLCAACLFLAGGCGVGDQPCVDYQELNDRIGATVTVRGRSSERLSSAGSGERAFTLRDEVKGGPLLLVRGAGDAPIMGVTVVATGTVVRGPDGAPALQGATWSTTYVHLTPLQVALLAIGVVGFSAGAYWWLTPRPWGYARVIAGPNDLRGKQFDLRGGRAIIGRGLSVQRHVSLDQDGSISRLQAELRRRGSRILVRRLPGSSAEVHANSKLLEAGESVLLALPGLVQVGSRTTLEIGLVGTATSLPKTGGPPATVAFGAINDHQDKVTQPPAGAPGRRPGGVRPTQS